MSECNWIVTTSFKKPIDLHDDDRVMIAHDIGAGIAHQGGPYRASAVTWGKVTRYRRVVENGDVERMRAQLDDLAKENAALRARPTTEDLASARHQVTGLQTLNDELVAKLAGSSSASNLQHLFLASAEVRQARAQRDHASVKLDHALLKEQIATAISRGHLAGDFHVKLREWCK